jgi:hypothetical protein
MNDRQPGLFDGLEIPPILLLQDPLIDYTVHVQLLKPQSSEGSYLLRCYFDNVTPQAQARLHYRLRVYAFGEVSPREVSGPLTLKGDLSVWPADRGTIEILLGKRVQNKLVFTMGEGGTLTFEKGSTLDDLDRRVLSAGGSGQLPTAGQPFAPGTLGSCLEALTEEILPEQCGQCGTRHPRYLIVRGTQQAFPSEVIAYHSGLADTTAWLHHPCVQTEAVLRHPERDLLYGYVVDISSLWDERCGSAGDKDAPSPDEHQA